MKTRILIVGGVATGPKTAARCRRLDPEAEIIVIERQDMISYASCGMPFFIEDVIKDWNELLGVPTIRNIEYFRDQKGFTVLDKTEAKKINIETKTLTVENLTSRESKDLSYDVLVLATGARPYVPQIEGAGLQNVYRLYNPNDAKDIKQAIDSGARKVAIVGGGLIGLETCGAFVARGCEVTIFEMMPTLVPNLLDKEMALLLERVLRENGVRIIKGSPVSKIIGENGKAIAVNTVDGRGTHVDLVIIAIGVKPNVELAIEAGLEIGETGAIKVNEYLQTSVPDIYAGGDCVECTHIITGEKVYSPLGSTANKHGRVIADNINDIKTIFPGITGTAVFKILGYNCGTTGITEKKARQLGFDVVTTICPRFDISRYIPGAKYVVIKLIADKNTSRLLGCQVVGEGEGVKRIDVIATTIKFGGKLKELVDIDLGYAPVYSTAIDAIAHAANVLRNKIQGLAHGMTLLELKNKLDSDEDFILLDVRRRDEHQTQTFKDKRCINIPIEELKTRYFEIPQEKEIITFCLIGARAYIAERKLRGLGFKIVKFLDGSLIAWPFPDDLTT
jgi:NADPH-dependent 2,4-dienoyl-CoA reductase/sulfur reductase-like enzyme/rhodanese-related sulfurtransferase